MTVTVVLIPSNLQHPIKTIHVGWDDNDDNSIHDDHNDDESKNGNLKTENDCNDDDDDNHEYHHYNDYDDEKISLSIRSILDVPDYVETPLIRPLGESPGLFAYHYYHYNYHHNHPPSSLCTPPSQKLMMGEPTDHPTTSTSPIKLPEKNKKMKDEENIRATRLAMACGLLSIRFYGAVLLVRSHTVCVNGCRWVNIVAEDVQWPCEISSDLRRCCVVVVSDGVDVDVQVGGNDYCGMGGDTAAVVAVGEQQSSSILAVSRQQQQLPTVPLWISNAAQQNYHDAAAVARMVDAMKSETRSSTSNDDGDENDESSSSESSQHENMTTHGKETDSPDPLLSRTLPPNDGSSSSLLANEFVATSPLCLYCRRPTTSLCPDCEGAYFCPPPKRCIQYGWSHTCQCSTWKWYCSHRGLLSTFPFLDPKWQRPLVGRDFQLSEDPYRNFLSSSMIGISIHPTSSSSSSPSSQDDVSIDAIDSWWRTETDGWAGGESSSAKRVDIYKRRTYQEGFAPVPYDYLPPQRRCTVEDYTTTTTNLPLQKNRVGLYRLTSWEDYYRVRHIPSDSPVALLCTFPLTVYYSIVEYGEVPVTVGRILQRPVRIHIVGAEKEIHFLDLFQEVAYLLPEDVKVELVFVVREDMVPLQCKDVVMNKNNNNSETKIDDKRLLLHVEIATNLTVAVVGGTYNGGCRSSSSRSSGSNNVSSLDPNFDVGSGPPDMVMALNAGLYAYDSWRDVVEYLHYHKGVVGVFTDYNEYSGTNCAALGGTVSRDSLVMNPFRQPRAMPVYSMNLPQFSNGFLYVFNAQELD